MKRKYNPGLVKVVVKRSRAGLGLFALEDIQKGVCIIEYTGRALTQGEKYTSRSKYLFEINERLTIDGRGRDNIARYINHSCRPNTEPVIHKSRIFIFATRSIKQGEELCYDYGKEYVDAHIKPYGCRCQKCKSSVRSS